MIEYNGQTSGREINPFWLYCQVPDLATLVDRRMSSNQCVGDLIVHQMRLCDDIMDTYMSEEFSRIRRPYPNKDSITHS